MSPSTVIDWPRARRTTIRSSIGDRFCASSTTTWPNVRSSGSIRARASSSSANSLCVIADRVLAGAEASSRSISSGASRSPAAAVEPPAVLEQRGDQRLGRLARPRLGRQPLELLGLPNGRRDRLGRRGVPAARPLHHLRHQAVGQPVAEPLAARLVRAAPLRLGDQVGDVLGRHLDGHAADHHRHRLVRDDHALPQQPRQQHRHPAAAQQRRQLLALPGRPWPAGDQRVDRPLLDALLAQRRKHLRDVGDEHAVRADHQHALAGELRGPRTAARRRDAGRPRSCPCPGRPARPASRPPRSVISSYCSGVIVEMICRISPTRWRVMSSTIASVRCSSPPATSCSSTKPSTCAVLDVEPATARDPARVRRRRRVERLGGRRAPVDRQQLAVRVGDRMAADVQRLLPPPGRCARSTAARSRSCTRAAARGASARAPPR